jgi:type IV pilus assembly protein PilV
MTVICANKGFTLIELLIAIVLISLGLMGLYSMVVGTIHGNTFNKNYMIATVLARDQIERILHDDYTAVVAANYPQEDYTTMAGYEQFQRTVTIDVDTPNPDAKTVTVSVAWRNSTGATRNVRLRTIIVLLTP